ncbi:hypothetical protein PPL_02234 [Heterostelium album PN500]|uniref:Uncharacterized protein n=1 Tax=Heterostelium pallidum (strain ATCC 26659 / Pp 5 / PN500) TaxID=670386 RepID=D3B1R0_HETP5|nr:hypothetical protein PPL_02234 [Heterostelium album PN500]EFA85234.1 hypothetical protein PPL_02234 [Heterostelium album PN500]|eukprot:XP_020437343.1 hypothetical protein PPL_02234 [Heterostelium album PN500]
MLRSNTTLTSLDLSDNNIGANGAKQIMEGLRYNSTLTKLYFKNNKIGDNAGAYISTMIKDNKCLQYLDISENNLQTNAGILVSLSLESNSTLKYLNLAHNQMLEASNNSDSNIKRCHQALQNIFQRNKTMTNLELEGNCLLENIAKEINSSLARNLMLGGTRKKKKKLFSLLFDD